MGRYSKTKLKKNKKGITYRVSTVNEEIPEVSEDLWVISQYGDRLDSVASQYYGDPTLWWALAKANHLTTLILPIGTSLRIPPLSSIKQR
tara:strand:- start:136 stop:405 length:270 start_codon:yes stop_codon:yes gene_type:complete